MPAKQLPKLSIRLDLPDGTRFGPGKAELLRQISQTGSIAGAARTLNMSYPRALRLVGEMNTQFSGNLIEKFQGGAARGGATLTKLGKIVLESYDDVRMQSSEASIDAIKNLERAMRAS